MEAGARRDDARARGIRGVNAVGADADQFVVDRVPVCSDFWFGIDRGNALDVGANRLAVRVHLRETHSRSSWITDSGSGVEYLLWYLVRVQSRRGRNALL